MTNGSPTTECPRCKELEKLVASLQETIQKLQARVAALEDELAKARKDSSTSSKPPSGDIVDPQKSKKRPGRKSGKRKRGGQPGHERHVRPLFDQDQVDCFWEYRHAACPCCGGSLEDADVEPKRLQQVEILERPFRIEEHRRVGQRCTGCEKIHYVAWPEELVHAGLVGPRLTALVGWLKGVCHMSMSSIRRFFRDCIGVKISRGQVAKLVRKVSESLQDPYEELLKLLSSEDVLNVDETGHKDSGKRLWTWCFRASLYTVFKITPGRGSDVLIDVLGKEFSGLFGCDYFSAYRKYMRLNENVSLQFCLAHLIRDIKFLAKHPDPNNKAYGNRLLEHFRNLFGIIHRREEYPNETTFRRALERVKNQLVWDATAESPHTDLALNLEERFYRNTESYFRFITTPGIEPTNNLAEQAIRFIAIHRRVTQGTRGDTGQRWVERMATVVTSCTQQGRSAFDFLCEAIDASFSGQPAPSLAPDTS